MNKVSVEQYLVNLPPDLPAITAESCTVARRKMPGAHEFVYHNAVGYSLTESPFDRICYVAPEQGHVNFGFFFGAGLPDSKHLLEGKGARMRHLKIRSLADAQSSALARLIVATWKEAPDSIAEMHARRKTRDVST